MAQLSAGSLQLTMFVKEPQTMSDKIKVVYILGEGRSGTTLLDRLLGQIAGFLSMGEIKLLWKWGFEENRLCGCRAPFAECPFWTSVIQKGYGGPEQVDAEWILSLDSSLPRTRFLPRLILPGQRSRYAQELAAYSQVLGKLYRAIREVSGTRFIVDSSKNVMYSLVLNQLRDIDLHVVHLVRDSRAVAYSLQRKRLRPEVTWKESYMYTSTPGASARNWMRVNTLIHAVRPLYKHYTFLRYEDLVADPPKVLARLCTALGVPRPALEFLGQSKAYLESNHTIAGNPMRFSTGPVEIRLDEEWKEKMPRGQRLLVSALTLPLLLRYGYAAFSPWRLQSASARRIPEAERSSVIINGLGGETEGVATGVH
jgi:hypothetical protein